MYIKDIAKTTPLTREEEVVLTTLARRGNRAARKRVMEANMRFVLGVALTYKTSPLGVGDMVNEGMMGLSRAIDKFDPKTGMKFISYAVWWIRSYIGKAINEYGYSAIRLPANKYKKLFTSMTTGDTSKLNKQEIEMLPLMYRPSNLDMPVDGDSDTNLSEMIGDPNSLSAVDSLDAAERDMLVKELLAEMPEPARKAVEQHFFENCSSDELQMDLKLSRERIRQIKNRAIDRLRNSRTQHDSRVGELLRELAT